MSLFMLAMRGCMALGSLLAGLSVSYLEIRETLWLYSFSSWWHAYGRIMRCRLSLTELAELNNDGQSSAH